MSLTRANRNDLAAGEFLDAGLQIIKDGLNGPDTAIPMLLGSLTVRGIASASTATFYKRWDSLKDYRSDLITKLIDESLASPERVNSLWANLRALPKEHPSISSDPKSSILNGYIESCAAEIATNDPHLPVRWHTRPYLTAQRVEKIQALEISETTLSFIDGWGMEEPPESQGLTINGLQLLDAIDYRAFIDSVSH